jgi:hypothetical protein
MKKGYFLLLLICISISDLHAQKIYIGKTADFSHSLIDTINNVVYVYGDSLYKKIYLDSFKAESFQLHIPKEFEFKEYTALMVDTIPYFVHSKGGLVYEHRNDSLVRIDNSFNHLMQVYSSIFAYNSTIHRFGGYGFWSARNFITYFDTKNTREWDIINPENSEEFPEESWRGLHFLINDELYVFNSSLIPQNNRYEYVFNKKIWKYNFIEKKWTYLGDTEFMEIVPTTLGIIYNDKLVLFSEAKFIIIDVLNNTIQEVEKGVLGHQFYHVLNQFYHNNRFYFFDINNAGELYFSIATEQETIGKEISSKPFYTNNRKVKTWGLYTLMLIISLVILVIIKSLYKKYNKVLLIKNGLKYRGKFVELDEEASEILKLLIATDVVNSAEILKIVEKKQFSRAHNERLKFQKVEELNLKLKTLLGTNEELITSKKSDFDRRIRVYSIKRNYFLS